MGLTLIKIVMSQGRMLKVSNLTHYYKNNAVIKNLSFELGQSEMLCLSGRNGSGKSTLLRLLSGIEIPNQGEIEFDGFSVVNSFEKIKSKIGLNEVGIYSHLTIKENLELFSNLCSVSSDYLNDKINLFKLENELNKFPGNCSSGYIKRISFLISILKKPKLLLLDEPLVFLDVEIRKQILNEIKDTLERQASVVIATHLVETLKEEVRDFKFKTLQLVKGGAS